LCKRAIAAWANQLELNERWRHAFRYGDNRFLMANIEPLMANIEFLMATI